MDFQSNNADLRRHSTYHLAKINFIQSAASKRAQFGLYATGIVTTQVTCEFTCNILGRGLDMAHVHPHILTNLYITEPLGCPEYEMEL